MQYKETNLNYYIKVKLTEKGKQIYRNQYDEDDMYSNLTKTNYEIKDMIKK